MTPLDVIKLADAKAPAAIMATARIASGRVTAGSLALSASTEIEIGDGIDACVDAAKLAQILGKHPEATAAASNQWLTVRSGRSRWKLPALSSRDYPEIDVVGEAVGIVTEDWRRGIDSVIHCVAKTDVRQYLTGVRVQVWDDGVRMTASDGRRVARWTDGEIDFSADPLLDVTLPARSAQTISKLDGGLISLVSSGSHLLASCGAQQVTTGLIDGVYPDVGKVFKMIAAPTHAITVDAAELAEAIKDAIAIQGGEPYQFAKLEAGDGVLRVLAATSQHASLQAEIDAEVDGGEVCVGMGSRYLIDAMSRLSGPVKLSLIDDSKPMLIEGDDGCLEQIIMPARL